MPEPLLAPVPQSRIGNSIRGSCIPDGKPARFQYRNAQGFALFKRENQESFMQHPEQLFPLLLLFHFFHALMRAARIGGQKEIFFNGHVFYALPFPDVV